MRAQAPFRLAHLPQSKTLIAVNGPINGSLTNVTQMAVIIRHGASKFDKRFLCHIDSCY